MANPPPLPPTNTAPPSASGPTGPADAQTLFWLFFRFDGRVGRQVYWLSVLFLAALVGALGVLLPARFQVSSHRPDEQAQAFDRLLKRKSRWLTVTVISFGVGVGVLSVVLITALLTAT